jgi:hypothetical protein
MKFLVVSTLLIYTSLWSDSLREFALSKVYYPKKIKQHFLNRYSKRAKIIIENERVIS